MIRVLIADDHALIRDGLQTIIDLQEDMEVVGVAENGLQAYDAIDVFKPDVILMDIQMPVMNGIESTKRIKQNFPDTIVIILTTFLEDEYIIDGLVNGASGFMLKNLPAAKILEAIRDALKGHLMLPSEVAAKLSARLSYLSQSSTSTLRNIPIHHEVIEFTEREKQVIILMIEGKNNREIAGILFISEGTVKNYITIIYQKIGTNDRTKAVLLLKDMLLDETEST